MITLAIAGGGFMGAAHAANYGALADRVRVKWVASRPSERAAKVAGTVGAELTSDLDVALSDPDVDAIDICLPTSLHREFAERAFAAGKHVFLEKPIALSAEDADAVIDAARASGRVFMVGMVLRYWPEYVALQRVVTSGELGRPLSVSTLRLSPPADWADWFADPKQSGGIPVDLLVHDFDQMNWLLGKPRAVFARAPVAGHVHALVEYDGSHGSAEGSMTMPTSYPFSSDVRVLCEGGVAQYSFSAAPAEDGGNVGAQLSARGLRLYPNEGEPRTVEVESADPWGPELEAFLGCVEQGRQPEQGTGEQAREALLVALATNRSLASGGVEAV